MLVNGVSSPSSCDSPIAIAVFPVPGFPASRIALPPIYHIIVKWFLSCNEVVGIQRLKIRKEEIR
jgi:hypothetical protein